MRTYLLTLTALLISVVSNAHSIETVEITSKSMQRGEMVNIILPDSYTLDQHFPVVYLLHGYGDNHDAWYNRTDVATMADKYNIIIVMPDAGHNSWYFDSPLCPESKAESYIITELIPYIDSHYNTIADRSARAITGLSMGGHGALYLAIRHQDIFAFAGSTAGGVDLTPFPNNWEIASHLGPYADNKEQWASHSVINMTNQIAPNSLSLIIDCGVDDFFYEVNCNLHHKLLSEDIPHDFYLRPGAHNWDYWRISIDYQLLFFSQGFNSHQQN